MLAPARSSSKAALRIEIGLYGDVLYVVPDVYIRVTAVHAG